MDLTRPQRTELRDRMVVGFLDEPTLTMFLADHLDLALNTLVDTKSPFKFLCFELVERLVSEGLIDGFLQAIAANHANKAFRDFAQSLRAAPAVVAVPIPVPVPVPGPAAAAGNVPQKPFVISKRVIIDRHDLWTSVAEQATTLEATRTLVVTGGVGKSYSLWLISRMCDPKKVGAFASITLSQDGIINITAARLAQLITTRLCESPVITDTLAQGAREAKDLSIQVVKRLSSLPGPTWLFIDGFNQVSLDESGIDLLRTLCTALDSRECPNLWLFLIGLDPDRLGSDLEDYVMIDRVGRPKRKDIADYLVWFATTIGRPLTEEQLKKQIDELDATLPLVPQHPDWNAFHAKLTLTCQGIRAGILP